MIRHYQSAGPTGADPEPAALRFPAGTDVGTHAVSVVRIHWLYHDRPRCRSNRPRRPGSPSPTARTVPTTGNARLRSPIWHAMRNAPGPMEATALAQYPNSPMFPTALRRPPRRLCVPGGVSDVTASARRQPANGPCHLMWPTPLAPRGPFTVEAPTVWRCGHLRASCTANGG